MIFKINKLSANSSVSGGDFFSLDSNRTDFLFNAGFVAKAELLGVPFNYSYANGNNQGTTFIAPQFRMRLDVDAYKKKFVIPDFSVVDSLNRNLKSLDEDLKKSQQELNSLRRRYDQAKNSDLENKEFQVSDSMLTRTIELDQLDSLSIKISKQSQKLDSLQDIFTNLKSKVDSLQSFKKPKPSLLLKRPQTSFTNLELGLTQPQLGSYLLSGTMIRGGFVGLRVKKIEHSITAGLVSSFIMNELSGSPVQRLAERIDRIQNFNLEGGQRFLGAYQLLFGKKDSSHFYLGFLYGHGKRNILSNSNERARNFVGEFGKGVYHPFFGLLSLSLSQSLITNMISSNSENLSIQREKANSGYGFKLNLKGTIKSINLDYLLRNELLTPSFVSYGVALQRRDFWSINGQLTKRFKLPIQLGLTYRRDASNVFKSSPVSMTNEQYRLRYSQKIKKVIFINNDFFYLASNSWSRDFSQKIESIILTSTVTVLFPTSKKNESLVNSAIYSRSSDGGFSFQGNAVYTISPNERLNIRNTLSNQTTIFSDNSRKNVYNGSVALDFGLGKFQVSLIGGAGFVNNRLDWNSGLNISVSEGRLTGTFSAEKYLVDDFNNFNTPDINRISTLGWRALITMNYNIIGN